MPTAVNVTAGSLCQLEYGFHTLILSGDALALSIHLSDNGSFLIPSENFPGENYSLGGQLSGDQTLHNGPVDFNGQRHSLLWFVGTLKFVSTPFVMPANGPTPIMMTEKFEMSGWLQGFNSNPFIGNPGPTIIDVTLKGRGRATVRFSASQPSPFPGQPAGRWVRSMFHQFHT